MRINEQPKVAVFIDADNAPAKKIDVVLSEMALHGVVSIRRAYGNWKNQNLKGWEEMLHEHAIQPIQLFDLIKGKNATDIALVIDVMDILYTKSVDIICLVSSDCDFTPLVTRVLSDGKMVVGFGERKAPAAFVNSCSKFLYFDSDVNAGGEEVEEVIIANGEQRQKKLNGDTGLMNLLRQAVEAVEDEEGWAILGPVGTYISNRTSFDQRNYGFKKLSDLFAAIDLFEMRKTQGSVISVRDKKRAKQLAVKTDAP